MPMNKSFSQFPLVLTLMLTLIFGNRSVHGQYSRGDVLPEQIESIAWQAAAKKDELASYERFIARFPDSRFHQAAMAAIERFRQIDAEALSEKLNHLADTPKLTELALSQKHTSALVVPLGTRLLGPGVLVAGERSARQHILLPRGEWIPIASYDHELTGFASLHLSTVAFAKIDARQLEELLLVTFNRERPPPPAPGVNLTPSWPPADLCNEKQYSADYYLKDSDMRSRWCASIRSGQPSVAIDIEPKEISERVIAALNSLEVISTQFKYRAETHISAPSRALMSYTHFYRTSENRAILVKEIGESDVVLDKDLDAGTRSHYIQQAHFAYHAAIAFGHHYSALTLQPGQRARGSAVASTLGRAP